MAKIETKDLVKADLTLLGSLKSEKDRIAAIDKMEIGASDATLNRRICVYMWGLGKSATGNAPPTAEAYLKAFNAKFRGGTTGRPIVSDKTFATMASFYSNFSALGFVKGWETESVLVWILDNVKGEYSKRGAFIKDVVALTAEPDADTLGEMWKAAQKPPKLEARATAMSKAVKELAREEFFIPTLKDNQAVRVAYQKAVLALSAFEAAVKAAGGNTTGDDDAFAEIMRDAA